MDPEQQKTITTELYDAVYDINQAVRCNSHFSYRLARAIERAGKPVNDLTVGELRTIITAEKEAYNHDFAGN